MEQEKNNEIQEKKKKNLESSINFLKIDLKKKKFMEEYWLFFLKNLDFYTYSELIFIILRIWYINLIKLWRIFFIPFKGGFMLYENIFNLTNIKLRFLINLFMQFCLNFIYLYFIFIYNTYLYNYIMNIQLEKILDYFYF